MLALSRERDREPVRLPWSSARFNRPGNHARPSGSGEEFVWGGWGELLNLKTPHSDLGNQTLGAQRDSPVELICLASWVWGP